MADDPVINTSQVRAMSGHATLEEAFNAAPSDSRAVEVETERQTRSTKKRSSKKKEPPSAAEIAERDPRVKRYLNRMYGDGFGAVGTVPYEIWAWAANDPELALAPDEKEDWADGVYTLFASLDINTSSPKFIALSLLLMQLKFGMRRYAKYLRAQGIVIPDAVSAFIEGKPAQA